MPRRSAADLTLVPMLPGRGRPEPPKALDQAEARAWNDVVGRCHVHGILLVDPRCALRGRKEENQAVRGLEVGANSAENGLFFGSVTLPVGRPQIFKPGEEQLENRRGVCLAATHRQIDRWRFTLWRTADHRPRQNEKWAQVNSDLSLRFLWI